MKIEQVRQHLPIKALNREELFKYLFTALKITVVAAVALSFLISTIQPFLFMLQASTLSLKLVHFSTSFLSFWGLFLLTAVFFKEKLYLPKNTFYANLKDLVKPIMFSFPLSCIVITKSYEKLKKKFL